MGEGVDFDHAHTQPDKGLEIAANALIDMQLLSKCDAVFFGRWTSFASHIPYLFEKPGAAVFYDAAKLTSSKRPLCLRKNEGLSYAMGSERGVPLFVIQSG